jgi:hypothetical protein
MLHGNGNDINHDDYPTGVEGDDYEMPSTRVTPIKTPYV